MLIYRLCEASTKAGWPKTHHRKTHQKSRKMIRARGGVWPLRRWSTDGTNHRGPLSLPPPAMTSSEKTYLRLGPWDLHTSWSCRLGAPNKGRKHHPHRRRTGRSKPCVLKNHHPRGLCHEVETKKKAAGQCNCLDEVRGLSR